MNDDAELKRCQKASEAVERKIVELLLNYPPAHDLKVGDVIYIARESRAIAFDMFYLENRTKP